MLFPCLFFGLLPASLTSPFKMSSQTLPHIPIDMPKCYRWIPIFEIVLPPLQVSIDALQQLFDVHPASVSARLFSELPPFRCKRLLRWFYIQISTFAIQALFKPECIPKKVHACFSLQPDGSRLLPVQLQTHSPLQYVFYPSSDFFPLVPAQHDEIIRIPDQTGLRPLRRASRFMEKSVHPM